MSQLEYEKAEQQFNSIEEFMTMSIFDLIGHILTIPIR